MRAYEFVSVAKTPTLFGRKHTHTRVSNTEGHFFLVRYVAKCCLRVHEKLMQPAAVASRIRVAARHSVASPVPCTEIATISGMDIYTSSSKQ